MSTTTNHYDVIVVGGGIAGLSACVKLIESGVKNILLVEANERLGGRINSHQFQNTVLELGAQWIHGTLHNPIFELARHLKLVDDREHKEASIYYVSQDGSVVDENFVDKIFDKIENIFDNLEDQIENELEEDSDQSLGTLLDQGFVKVLKKLKSTDEDLDINLVKAIYRARLNEERFENSCDDLHRLSAIGWNEYEDFKGDEFCRLKHGFWHLLHHLATQVPAERLRLGEPVEKIDWTAARGEQHDSEEQDSEFYSKRPIQVHTCERASTVRHVYSASFVVSTCSVGFLKEHHHSLFVPKLPLVKIKAIENLGFGVVNKLFVVFDEDVFVFPGALEALRILWREDLDGTPSNSIKKWNLENNRFFKQLDNFEVLAHKPNVLLCFTAGIDATYIESLSDECLLDVLAELFERCFPRLNLPRPQQLIRSRWYSEPFARGSYTYIRTGSNASDCQSLAASINNQLFFAGEATNHRFISTVHGAYISGRDAASKIFKTMKKNY